MCIDYIKLNDTTRKDGFPLSFVDPILEWLARHLFFCYLDRYLENFQIPIHPSDQEKTTFTCLTKLLLTVECHVGCVMPRPPFKGACLPSFPIMFST